MVTTVGLVDTHIHGFMGQDTSDGCAESIVKMARSLATVGVAAFMPTTMTTSYDVIIKAFEAVSEAKELLKEDLGPHAEILGIHLEGPFLSPKYAGVQSPEFIKNPDIDFINELEDRFPGLLKIIDVAPEMDGAIDFINCLKDKYILSLAHTEADYDCAKRAFEAGATSVTHTLNAMAPMDKRAPGVVGAAFDFSNPYMELICDGIHINPSIIRMLIKLFPEDRIIVVSDAMRGANMPDGEYELGNEKVSVRGGRTYFGPNGGLAGSVTFASQEVSRLVSFGIDFNKAMKFVTSNPLHRINSDFDLENYPLKNIWDDEGNLVKVLWNGEEI